MKRLIVVALFALPCLAALPAQAQTQREQLSQRGCAVAADMILVARSLSAEGVDRARAARIMALIYVSQDAEPAAAKLREATLALGYSRAEKPIDLARVVGEACIRSGGDQDAIFGTRLRWSY